MRIVYGSYSSKLMVIEISSCDDNDLRYEFDGHRGDFISEILNNDYSLISYLGYEYSQELISRSEEMEKLNAKTIKLLDEIGDIVECNKEAFRTKNPTLISIQSEISMMQKLVQSLDLGKYQEFVNAVFIDTDKTLNCEQRFTAYSFSHDYCEFGNFSFTSHVNSDVGEDIEYYEELVELTKNERGQKGFALAKEYIRANKLNCEIMFWYTFDKFEDLIKLVLYDMARNNETLKVCQNCGKYFYPAKRSDTIYCDKASPQDITKTCKEYGAIKTYQDNLKTNPTMRLYRNIYMAKQMLVKRNPDISTYATDFENYKTQSRQWKADVKKGAKTNDEFLAWLKSNRRKDGE